MKNLEVIEAIGKEVNMPNLLDRIRNVGKKRTEILDEAGIASKQIVMKTEDGYDYPARCYAYVPDTETVSTWKLRLCAPDSTEITREQLGAAAAAFSEGGFRGQQVELPEEDVAKVKARIRDEYAKLGVELEDIPEGVKENRDMEMVAKKEDGVAMLRTLAEIVANIQDEELRNKLALIVESLQGMVIPEEESEMESEETVTEESAMVEEKQACETKEVDIAKIAEALKLDALSAMLEAQNKAIQDNGTNIANLVNAIGEIAEKNKAVFDRLEELEEQTKSLKRSDVEKIAEKQLKFTPVWGGYRATKASETVLSEEDARKYDAPEVPSVIKNMSKRILGGK